MIHKFSQNGYNIVMDVNSGAVHSVDDITYDILDLFIESQNVKLESVMNKFKNKYCKDQIIECYDEIKSLIESDMLFSQDTYEPYAEMMVSSPVKAMCLHIAHDCNLRCTYCFAQTGDFGGHRALMSFDTGKRAIDFLIEKSKGRKNLELDFFGGEPLMNFKVVKQIVEYARSLEKQYNKNFRFTITTNGILLDSDKIDYINKEMSNVVLSIDGRKEINDLLRRRVDNSGSYDTIVPKYLELVNKRGHDQYYVRGTFTKHNLDFSEDVMHLNELGFDQISVEPVVSDPHFEYSLDEGDLPAVYSEYEKLALKLLDLKRNSNGFNFFHFMIDLEQGPCAIKRLRGCGCGNEYVAVTPEGDIYPCHQFVGNESYKMGNLYDNMFNTEMKDTFAKANIYGKSECKECWAKFYCSGGCNANNMQYCGDILKPHKISCDLEKKRLECAIMMKVALSDNND